MTITCDECQALYDPDDPTWTVGESRPVHWVTGMVLGPGGIQVCGLGKEMEVETMSKDEAKDAELARLREVVKAVKIERDLDEWTSKNKDHPRWIEKYREWTMAKQEARALLERIEDGS